MRNDQITGSLPVYRQSSTHPSANSAGVVTPTYVRATPFPAQSSHIAPLPASSTEAQPADATGVNLAISQFGRRNSNMSPNQFRMAINNGGPDFFRQPAISQPASASVHKRCLYKVKTEYAFGMSDADRKVLLDRMKIDVRQDGTALNRYNAPSIVNPNAVKELRQAAKKWHDVPGNYISQVSSTNMESFFRGLVPLVSEKYREAALALIEQPQGYAKPLPGTRAEALSAPQPSPWAPNPTLPVARSQPSESTSNNGALAYRTASTMPWTTPNAAQPSPPLGCETGSTAFVDETALPTMNKRSFAAVDDGPASSNDPSPTFKRSRPDDVPQASSYSAPHDIQPVSSWSSSHGMSRASAMHQPPYQVPTASNLGSSNDQADLFQGGSFHDPSQSQTSSSWSASNGMSRPTAPYQPMPHMQSVSNQGGPNYQTFQGGVFQGANANGPFFAGQPSYGVSGAFVPSDSWFMSDHELNETMKLIDNLAPLLPATQGHMAVSALPIAAVSSQTAPLPVPTGATMAQPPLTSGYSAIGPLQALPQSRMPSTGQP